MSGRYYDDDVTCLNLEPEDWCVYCFILYILGLYLLFTFRVKKNHVSSKYWVIVLVKDQPVGGFCVSYRVLWFLSRRGPVRSDKRMRLPASKARLFNMHASMSDSCVGAEWQGPVWVVNHSDSALGRRSGMVPVDEWPLTLGVRTEASLNNSWTETKRPGRR